MEEKIHTYENDQVEIRYDLNRCIHAAECVKGLPNVFDPEKRPWIQPGEASVENIISTVEKCPTGALQYTRKDTGTKEQKPSTNTISVVPDGPVYLRGDIEVRDHEGNVVLNDTRFALCRCGLSGNKPACDNTHSKKEFEAPAAIDSNKLQPDNDEYKPGKLVLKMMKDGPALVEGSYEIYSQNSPPRRCAKNIALCRCGASENKPFCDGSHKDIGFKS